MCQCCSPILWPRRKQRCTRVRATGSLSPPLAATAVWEKKCEPQQFNDVRALILLQMRAFLVLTTEETKCSACVHTWVGHSFHYIGSACSWRRGHEKLGGIGQRWLEFVGRVRKMRCRDRGEGEKLRYRLARRELLGTGFMICWMDHEPVFRSLETAAIRTLRSCATNERTIKKESELMPEGTVPSQVPMES